MNNIRCFAALIFMLIFSSCTTVSYVNRAPVTELVPIEQFCRQHSLEYTYSPFQEEIKLEGKQFLATIKPGYRYAMLNGNSVDLGIEVSYKNGQVFVPLSLASRPVIEKKPSPIWKRVARYPYALGRIVVDAGHGGKDPGAVSKRGIKEKDVNLKVAKYLRDELKRKGYKVYMTRDSDEFISLKGRTDFAKKKKADLFISIHANSISKSSVSGLEVYYLSSKYTDQQAIKLAESEKLGEISNLKNASTNVRRMVSELLSKENRRGTLEFSSLILKTAASMGIKTRKSKGAPFYVLKNNICPSVLVELGYLTNSREERLLTSALYQKQLASCLSFAVGKLDSYMAKTSRIKYVSRSKDNN